MSKLAGPAFEEINQVKMFVEQLRLASVPARASLGFASMYGYGRLTQANEMVLFFKNYGFSDAQLILFSESFDALGDKCVKIDSKNERKDLAMSIVDREDIFEQNELDNFIDIRNNSTKN